jgi:hypothetical protein
VLPRNSEASRFLNRNLYVTSGFASPFRSILIEYRARSEKRYQFGPAAGSSAGIQFAITVRELGASVLLYA